MGPWLCSHGNRTYDVYSQYRLVLQWGRGCVATEIMSMLIHRKKPPPLQWGRGCVATEMAHVAKNRLNLPDASMGPWLCSHGNYSISGTTRNVYPGFNGAVAV